MIPYERHSNCAFRASDPRYPEAAASIHTDEYYVNMMIVWHFAAALAKQEEVLLPHFLHRLLPPMDPQESRGTRSYLVSPETLPQNTSLVHHNHNIFSLAASYSHCPQFCPQPFLFVLQVLPNFPKNFSAAAREVLSYVKV